MANGDALFGRFSGQSKLKQGDRFIRLTPDESAGAPAGQLALLTEAIEHEGAFGIVSGKLDGNTLFEAEVEEVIPPILSRVLDRLLQEQSIDAAVLLPEVEQALRALSGPSTPPPAEGATICALVVGHRPSARGAQSSDGSVNEFDFNTALAEEIKNRVKRARVELVFRDNTPDGLTKLPAKINALGPHFVVSMHCNAFNGTARGAETLYFHTSDAGHELAKIVQRRVVDALGARDRHTKPREQSQRGGRLLRFTKAPCVICEPFFIDNDADLEAATRRRITLANAYAAALDEAAQRFSP